MVFIISYAAHAKAQCPGVEKISINRPISSGNKSFQYTFQYHCKNPSLITIIHIPGGPGLTSIDSNPLVDKNVNVIETDPRGSGENVNFWAAGGTEGDLSTEKIAEDIIAIIKSQNLNNYTLHGNSFGTAVATVVASKLETANHKDLPKAIILEGVVGREEQVGEQSLATQKVFKEIITESDFCVSCKLDSLKDSLSSIQIGNLVESLLFFGKDLAMNVLKTSSSDELNEMGRMNSEPLGFHESKVYNAIACKEYFINGITDTSYVHGELFGPVGGSCKSQKLDHPFNSRDWQVKVKTYYLVGTADNFTPISQARYHFENQTNINKEVICVSRGGHTPLTYNMQACSDQVFNKMSHGLSVTTNDLIGCNASV